MAKDAMGERVLIRLIGQVCVISANGTECQIRARRARGILALLALSPGMMRARPVLQKMFWPNRTSASGSLRSELYNLRLNLRQHKDIIDSNANNIWLRPERVQVDIADFDAVAWAGEWGSTPPRLMEDLDLDNDFNQWREEQQTLFDKRFSGSLAKTQPIALPTAQEEPSGQPVIRIVNLESQPKNTVCFPTMKVSEAIWRGMREYGGIILTNDPTGRADLEISIAVQDSGDVTSVILVLTDIQSRTMLWSAGRDFPNNEERFSDTNAFRLFVNETAYICASSIGQLARYDRQAIGNTLRAVNLMMRADASLFGEADSLLEQAFEIDGNAIHLAWRAYLRTFIRAEGGGADAATVREEAEAFSRKALDLGGENSLVLALLSHVYSFVLQNPSFGGDLAERALDSNPANPFALAYLGRAKSYMGDHKTAFELTAKARRVAGPVPYRHTLDFMAGIAALLSGRRDEAIHLGETAIAQAPTYRAPMRYLLPLYASLGRQDDARRIHNRMREIEPDFSIERLKDEAYPNAAIRQANLLDFSRVEL